MMKKTRAALDDINIHVRFKIAALWTSVMFCYIYGDYFGLYKPGTLQGMLEGKMGPLGAVTQAMLLGTSVMLAVPGVMVFLTLALPPALSRWLNVIFGVVYTVIMILTMPGEWAFYVFFGIVEVVLTGLVAAYAWTWPRTEP